MKFILGVDCVPNEECFVLFFPECMRNLVPMTNNYGPVELIRSGKYGIGPQEIKYKTPKKLRNSYGIK